MHTHLEHEAVLLLEGAEGPDAGGAALDELAAARPDDLRLHRNGTSRVLCVPEFATVLEFMA